jgi:hypothetical protein
MRRSDLFNQSKHSDHESAIVLASSKIPNARARRRIPDSLVRGLTETTSQRSAGSTSGVDRFKRQLPKMRRIRSPARKNYFHFSRSTSTRMNASMTFPDCEFDEALWAAYRRRDKVAVTEKLLGHVVAAVTQSRLSAPRLRQMQLKYPIRHARAA